jgi:DNA polymerase III delta subunit
VSSLPSWATRSSRLFLSGSEEWLELKRQEIEKALGELLRLSFPPEEEERFLSALSHPSLFGGKERWIWISLARGDGEKLLSFLPSDPDLHLFLATSDPQAQAPGGFDLYRESDSPPDPLSLPVEIQQELDRLCEGHPLRRKILAELITLASYPEPPGLETLRWFLLEDPRFDGMRFAQKVALGDLIGALEEIRRWEDQGGSPATIGRDLLGAVGYRLRQLLKEKIEKRAHQQRGPSPLEIGALLEALRELDRLLKTASIPPGILLRQFTLRSCGRDRR